MVDRVVVLVVLVVVALALLERERLGKDMTVEMVPLRVPHTTEMVEVVALVKSGIMRMMAQVSDTVEMAETD